MNKCTKVVLILLGMVIANFLGEVIFADTANYMQAIERSYFQALLVVVMAILDVFDD